MIGDTNSAGLVSRDGSIDWLCLPRFDSPACFAALLDREKGGRWKISPTGEIRGVRRAYRPDSMVLETTFETEEGSVKVVDCLGVEEGSDLLRGTHVRDLVLRMVVGMDGKVPMGMVYRPRFDYGNIEPLLRAHDRAVEAVGGPDALDLRSDVELAIDRDRSEVTADFTVEQGASVSFIAAHHRSHLAFQLPEVTEGCAELIERTDAYWKHWLESCTYSGRWRDAVIRSLLTLKSMSYSPTGGIVAAPTTSLPENIGGGRNWDYRYCWLRDSTFMLEVLLEQGFTEEAKEWRDWLLRAVAGDPKDMQIMYGVAGERRLPELELDWLEGYEGSSPVRVGNGATDQFQLDVYGEVMDSFHSARRAGIETEAIGWELERSIVDHVCERWREPDEGIWEVRSGREHFVHSKVMAWVALDRAVKAVENHGLDGPVDRWRRVRDEVRSEIMEKGVDPNRRCFTRAFGDKRMDSALLMLPLVGFIEVDHPVMVATIEEISKELSVDGMLLRYRTEDVSDGLPSGEGSFLLCSFWLADCLALSGRYEEAEDLFERLLDLRNDVGLLSEEYDLEEDRMVGNFPQVFSHTAIVTTAMALERERGAGGVRRGE